MRDQGLPPSDGVIALWEVDEMARTQHHSLCDILGCSPTELVEPYVQVPAHAKGGSAGAAPPTRPRRARVVPSPRQ